VTEPIKEEVPLAEVPKSEPEAVAKSEVDTSTVMLQKPDSPVTE
jgi:hypothetical protein